MTQHIPWLTLFQKFLMEKGIASTRVKEMDDAFIALHKALCALDISNLELIARLGGVQGLLQKFSEAEEVRDVGLELKEMKEVLDASLTKPEVKLPLVLAGLKTSLARGLAEDVLRGERDGG